MQLARQWGAVAAGAFAIAVIVAALALPLNALLDIPDIDCGLWLTTGAQCAVEFAIHAAHLLIWDECCARNLRFTHWQGKRNTPLIVASILVLHLVVVPMTLLLSSVVHRME